MCDRSTSQSLCPGCHRQVQSCQLPIDGVMERSEPGLSVLGWGEYGGALKRAIATLKYNNHPRLAEPLGQGLATTWLNQPLRSQPFKNAKGVIVVPIPMHPDKQAQRGFNQAELIARSFCQITGLPLKCHGLARIQATQAQFTLSPQAREQNLAGAFALGRDFLHQRPTGTVLLIDDIYTTGATVRSAALALRQQQISVLGVGAVAIVRSKSLHTNDSPRKALQD
jgi:ComF family protein